MLLIRTMHGFFFTYLLSSLNASRLVFLVRTCFGGIRGPAVTAGLLNLALDANALAEGTEGDELCLVYSVPVCLTPSDSLVPIRFSGSQGPERGR